MTNIDENKPFYKRPCPSLKKCSSRDRKWSLGLPISSIHINTNMNISIHIDIMWISIPPHAPTPFRGRLQTGPAGGGLAVVAVISIFILIFQYEYWYSYHSIFILISIWILIFISLLIWISRIIKGVIYYLLGFPYWLFPIAYSPKWFPL